MEQEGWVLTSGSRRGTTWQSQQRCAKNNYATTFFVHPLSLAKSNWTGNHFWITIVIFCPRGMVSLSNFLQIMFSLFDLPSSSSSLHFSALWIAVLLLAGITCNFEMGIQCFCAGMHICSSLRRATDLDHWRIKSSYKYFPCPLSGEDRCTPPNLCHSVGWMQVSAGWRVPQEQSAQWNPSTVCLLYVAFVNPPHTCGCLCRHLDSLYWLTFT